METEVTKDPQVELMELKLAVKMFCKSIEICAIIEGSQSSFLRIQIESVHYKHMKSKITDYPIPTREEVESTETL